MTMDWMVANPLPAEAPEPTAHQGGRRRARRNGSRSVALATPSTRVAALTRAAPPTGGTPSLLPTTTTDQWVPLGPMVTVHGQADRHPRISGRVRAIAVSNDGQRIYAGSAQGGVWFSSDGGERWLALDFYATTKTLSGELGESNALAVGSIAVRFGANAGGADDDVYVGTGERRKQLFSTLPGTMQGVGIRVAHGPAATVRRDGPTADPWTLEATELAGDAVLRLAADDRAGVVWAATSEGVFRRTPSGPTATWTKIDTGLDETLITDVLVTRGQTGEPRRIYVASAERAVAWSVTGEPGTWTYVGLSETPAERRADDDVTRIALAEGNTPGKVVVYALANNPRLWRIEDSTPEAVIGLPERLFKKQANYDMAIAVHPPSADPSLQDRIAVGGSAVRKTANDHYNASLFAAPVRKSGGKWRFEAGGVLAEDEGLPPSWIGEGVHADVHDLSWIPGPGGKPQLWVACDGGVFRSEPSATPGKFKGGFKARNSGLATIEAQYLAQHPTSDAVLIVGTQDNGTLRWLGGGTWRVAGFGDGGGAVFDPRDGRNLLRQYVAGDWDASTNGGRDVWTQGPTRLPATTLTKEQKKTWEKAAEEEDDASSFYSNCAVIANGSVTQAAVGTDRVWLTTDWGEHWVTLPSLAKPYDLATPGAPDRTTDVYSAISVLRWMDPDHLYVVSEAGIDVFARSFTTWSRVRLYDAEELRDTKVRNRPPDMIPPELPITDLVVHNASLRTLYLGTSGRGGDHVWWFDGVGRFLPAGISLDDKGVKRRVDSPVHALAVDPAHPEIVYAGTDVGVFKGVGVFPTTGNPSWTWTHYSNALPEAACIDLVIHPQHRLMRAALRGRGVWEVALDGAEQKPEVFVRAHEFDTRRKPIPVAGTLDPTANPSTLTQMRLDASPDVRVFRAPGTKPPPPFTLAPGGHGFFDTWLMQSAQIALGERIEADGTWKQPIIGLVGGDVTTIERWNALVGPPLSNILPFDHDPPDTADLAENFKDEPDRKLLASCAAGTDTVRIFVALHGRDWRPLANDSVHVTVLRTAFNGLEDLSGIAALPVGWAQAVVADITAAKKGAWLVNKPWAYVDPVNPFRQPTAPIEPGRGQVVSFDVKLPAPPPPTGQGIHLLLALVHATDDPLDDPVNTTETNVNTLVRNVRHVAARSVRVFH